MLRWLSLRQKRVMRRLGPFLTGVAALTALGLSAHAAFDWHRHGSTGAGFFHLHVHVGYHQHHEADHHESESPEPDSGSEQRGRGTLTMVAGIASAPAVAVAEEPGTETDDRVPVGCLDLADAGPVGCPWSPRAPPVPTCFPSM